jgi:hypothetical protein
MTATFRRSSYSGNSGNCVEVAGTLDVLRDSKNTDVELPVRDMRPFVQLVKAGRFMPPAS